MDTYSYQVRVFHEEKQLKIFLSRKSQKELSYIDIYLVKLTNSSIEKESLLHEDNSDIFHDVFKTAKITSGNDKYIKMLIKTFLSIKFTDSHLTIKPDSDKYMPYQICIYGNKNTQIYNLNCESIILYTNTELYDNNTIKQIHTHGLLTNNGILYTYNMNLNADFVNKGEWYHEGDLISNNFKITNHEFIEFKSVLWTFTQYSYANGYNHKIWIFDNVTATNNLHLMQWGKFIFKNSKINFSWLIGGQNIFSSGQYNVIAFQNKLTSFVDNYWTITENPQCNTGNYMCINPQGFGPVGDFVSEKILYYNVTKLPELISGIQDIYLDDKNKTRKIDDLSKVKCSGTVHLTLQNLLIPDDLEINNINHINLTINSPVNIPKSFKTLGLTMNILGNLTIGTSNTQMGTLATTNGALIITAHIVDNRFGKIYGKGLTQIMSIKGDILNGTAINKGPFLYGINGSYIASGDSLELNSATELKNSYGQIFSLKMQKLQGKSKITNLAGDIMCGEDIHINTPNFNNTRDGTYTQPIGNWTWAYSGCYNYCESSDQAFLRSLKNIYFDVNTGSNLASTILAQQNIYYYKKEKGGCFSGHNYTKNIPTTFTSQGRDNYGYGCNDKVGYQRGCSPCSSYPATLKSGESIQINTGTFTISGNMNSPIISISAVNGIFHNTSRTRPIINPTETIFIDMTQLIKSQVTNQGLLQLTDKGEVVSVFDTGKPYIQTDANILLMNQNIQLNDTFNPLAKLSSSMFDLFIQSTLSEIAGKINLKDGKGMALGKKLWDNAVKFQQLTNKVQITRDDIQKASHAMLVREIQEIDKKFQQKTILCLPPGEIDPDQADGDISTDEFTCKTENDQTHLNTRIVARNLLNVVSKNGSVHRKTESYIRTTWTDDSIITEDVAMPTQTMICLNGDVNITAYKDSSSVGTYTEGNNINETVKTGNIISNPLILHKVVETKHEKDDGLFSTTTVTDRQTSHSAVQPVVKSERKIHKKAKQTIIQTATHDMAKSKIVYEANDLKIESIIKANKTEHIEETSGITDKSISSSQETPSVFNASINAPKIQFKTHKATLKGIAISGEVIEDYTDDGLNLEPVIAEMHYSQQMLVESPLAKVDVGCRGSYEVMIPTSLSVNKIIRMMENGEIKMNSVVWDKNKTEIIGKFTETTHILKKWHTEWCITEQVIPDEALIIVSLAVAYATMGVGATLTGFTGTAGVMASAGFSTICNVAGTSILRTGDPINVAKDIFSNNFLKNLTISIASAGLTSSIGDALKINMNPALTNAPFIDFLKVNALQTGINIPLQAIINNEPINKIAYKEIISCLADTIAMKTASIIGQNYRQCKMDFLENKALHAINGGFHGMMMKAIDKNVSPVAGVIGAVVGETLAELNPFNIKDIKGQMTMSKMVAGTIAMMFKQDVQTAVNTAIITIENNWWPCIVAALTALGWTHVVADAMKTYEETGDVNKTIDSIVINGIVMRLSQTAIYYGGQVIKISKDLWKVFKLNPKAPQTAEMLRLELAIKEKMGEAGRHIAGAETIKPLWDKERIIRVYGGHIEDWAKKSSNKFTHINQEVEIHWLENIKTQRRVEYKVKPVK